MGILNDDPRVIEIYNQLEDLPQKITKDQLWIVIKEHLSIVEKVLSEDFVMPDFQNFKIQVNEIYEECKNNNKGKNADYIPELAK
jgi:glutaminase